MLLLLGVVKYNLILVFFRQDILNNGLMDKVTNLKSRPSEGLFLLRIQNTSKISALHKHLNLKCTN
jgi:hypothetical protein